MSNARESLRAKRIKTVTLDGVEFTLRRPDARRFLLRYRSQIGPELQRVREDQNVLRESEAEYTAKLLRAEHREFYDFVCLCICDACISPKVVMLREEADADPTGGTIWIEELTDSDKMDVLAEPVLELAKISLEEAR